MALKDYHWKRDFQKTPEPAGDKTEPRDGKQFVVQKHDASRLHYDFRLELDGVLKSWAVPKGPSRDPHVKALAVEVEDHPLEYANFEGVIPAGQYGGGTVMIWDRGQWQPEGDAAQGLRKGKLDFELRGEKLHGRWTLVRMAGREDRNGKRKNWLLIKRTDEAARAGTKSDERARSVVSGRTMQQIAAAKDNVWESRATPRSRLNAAPVSSAREIPLPRSLKPQLASLVSKIPEGDNWLHELKLDGYRIVAWIDAGRVTLRTRAGNTWTDRFPTVVRALKSLNLASAILDGEIVALNERGASDFQRLQNWMRQKNEAALIYYVFDVPYLNGYDLRAAPLVERKKVLSQSMTTQRDASGAVRLCEHVVGQGEEVLEFACRSSLEGVVSKRIDSPYQSGRTKTWVKTKCLQRQEFVVGGYTRSAGSRTDFGALLLGYYQDGKLIYCGHVGTGFTRSSLAQIRKLLEPLRTDESAFANPPRGTLRRQATWVRPTLVAEVEFGEWAEDGMLRHPSFKGLREDKTAKEVIRERTKSPAARTKSRFGGPALAERAVPTLRADSSSARVAGVTISNPGRIVYPEAEISKLDVARYYESVAEWALPHVVNRPLTLVRCPQGRHKHCFYQRHLTESMPKPLRGVTVEKKDGSGKYLVIDDLQGLITLVQMGVLEIHPWGARADDIERPDRLVFDLDPGEGATWQAVIDSAREVRDYLQDTGLTSFVRTSGGKGLHVVVPLTRRNGWDEVRQFCEFVAVTLAGNSPERYVANMSKAKRRGKVFIDYLRNQRAATTVASYSTRAKSGATVATPLRWDELSPRISVEKCTIRTVPARLESAQDDPWDGFFSTRQSITAKMLARVNSSRG